MEKENLTNEKSSLTIITGPMFAGKTKKLLKQIHFAQSNKKNFLVFKPFLGVSYHSAMGVNAIVINKSKEIKEHLKKYSRTEVIFVDKLHFFDRGIVKTLNKLAKKGYSVVAAGLDQDFRGKPFENTAFLLALAERVIKLASVCQVCQKAANMTQRLINKQPVLSNDPIILVGGKEIYEARCRTCHVIRKLEASIGEKIN